MRQNLIDIVRFKASFLKLSVFYFANNNYDAISQLWNARNIEGSGVIYTGGSIHPKTIDELILMYWFYTYPKVIDETFYFGDPFTHVAYAKQYFILLLLRTLAETASPHFSKIKALENYMLRDFAMSRQLNLRISFDEPIEAIKNNQEALKLLNTRKESFDISEQTETHIQESKLNNDPELLFKKLDAFLDTLSRQCQEELNRREANAALSNTKIQRMKEEFWRGYYDKQGLLQRHLKSDTRLASYSEKKSALFGLRILISRDRFIEDTNIFALDSDMGWQFALSENAKLYQEIAGYCDKEAINNWHKTLQSLRNPLIFVTVRGRYDFLASKDQIGLEFSSGNIFIKREQDLPNTAVHQIMMTPDDRKDNTIPFMLILEKDTVGTVVYSNPLTKEEPAEDLFEHFRIMPLNKSATSLLSC